MSDIKPGMAVEYTQIFRGVVVHMYGEYVSVRGSGGVEYQIKREQVLRVLNPEPPEGQVIAEVACPRCEAKVKQLCRDVRYKDLKWEINHPHPQRTKAWVEKTGWTP